MHFIPESSAKSQNLALSLGVSPHSPWDLEMANLGFKVVQYDASVDAPYKHPNITFHKKFVGAQDGESTISFERAIANNRIDESAHNIAQIDIENAEWEILETIDLAFVARHFAQIIIEFHDCDPLNKSKYRLGILEKLRAHFTPIHAHFNNYARIFYGDGLFFSDVIKVSYLRNDLMPNDATKRRGVGTIVGLDSPNAKDYPEIPVIFP